MNLSTRAAKRVEAAVFCSVGGNEHFFCLLARVAKSGELLYGFLMVLGAPSSTVLDALEGARGTIKVMHGQGS